MVDLIAPLLYVSLSPNPNRRLRRQPTFTSGLRRLPIRPHALQPHRCPPRAAAINGRPDLNLTKMPPRHTAYQWGGIRTFWRENTPANPNFLMLQLPQGRTFFSGLEQILGRAR